MVSRLKRSRHFMVIIILSDPNDFLHFLHFLMTFENLLRIFWWHLTIFDDFLQVFLTIFVGPVGVREKMLKPHMLHMFIPLSSESPISPSSFLASRWIYMLMILFIIILMFPDFDIIILYHGCHASKNINLLKYWKAS